MARKQIRSNKGLIRRLVAGFFSENTYNTIAFYVFYFGYVTRMAPIERPVRQKLGDLGEVILVHHRTNPYELFLRMLGVCGLVQYVLFQVVQMVRFIPTEGFTLRVVYVVFYFALQLVCSMLAYVNLKNEERWLHMWNCVEANTKLCQRHGVTEAVRWKYNPMGLLALVPVVLGTMVVAPGLVVLFALKPNLPAHIFYLLPEPWKAYTTAYVAMVIWQAFLVMTAVSAIIFMLVISVAFIFGTKFAAIETASSASLSIAVKIRIFRAIEMVNQIANEIVRSLYLPSIGFCTIATGVTFTYIALTRYGDPHLGLPAYCVIVFADVAFMVALTICWVEIGKYSDASAELIESIRMDLKEPKNLADPGIKYLRKKMAALRPMCLNVGSYAKVDVNTVKLVHETIVDYLLLLFEL